MKKSDLKTGMRVTLNNGGVYLVMLQCKDQFEIKDMLINIHFEKVISLSYYCENLTYTDGYYDIVKIEECVSCRRIFSEKQWSQIWELKERPEYTMDELIKRVGHEFKIKKYENTKKI